ALPIRQALGKCIRPLPPQARQVFAEGVELREFGREIADQAAIVAIAERREVAIEPFEPGKARVPQQGTHLGAALPVARERRQAEGVLALEMAVEGALRHTGRRDDLLNTGRMIATA